MRMKNEFTNMILAGVKEAVERDIRTSKLPVTKEELNRREKERSKPVFRFDLQPDGSMTQTVNTQVEKENEQRISFIKSRLERRQSTLKRDFDKSR